jgi:hypothetical protein
LSRPACVTVCALTHLYGCEIAGDSLRGPQHVLECVAHVAECNIIDSITLCEWCMYGTDKQYGLRYGQSGDRGGLLRYP